MAMQRISQEDADILVGLIKQLEAHIVAMYEKMGEEEIGW
jgi:hypothetical protein